MRERVLVEEGSKHKHKNIWVLAKLIRLWTGEFMTKEGACAKGFLNEVCHSGVRQLVKEGNKEKNAQKERNRENEPQNVLR